MVALKQPITNQSEARARCMHFTRCTFICVSKLARDLDGQVILNLALLPQFAYLLDETTCGSFTKCWLDKCLMADILTLAWTFRVLEVMIPLNVTTRIRTIVCVNLSIYSYHELTRLCNKLLRYCNLLIVLN